MSYPAESLLFAGLLFLLVVVLALIAKFYSSKSGTGAPHYFLFLLGGGAFLAGQFLMIWSESRLGMAISSWVTILCSLFLAVLSLLLYKSMMSVKE